MGRFGSAFFGILFILYTVLSNSAIAKTYEAPKSFSEGRKSLAGVERKVMPPVDTKKLREEDTRREADPRRRVPYRFAEAIVVNLSLQNSGTWESLPDGSRLWRLRILSSGAQTLNLAFTRFDLPEGARLWIYNPSGDHVEGPYMAKNRNAVGELWTPVIRGEEIVVELHLLADVVVEPVVEVGRVNHGYRGLGNTHKSCNIDVICPKAKPWQNQVRSVAWWTFGALGCTGQLLNNTKQDFTPYFLTASHCVSEPDVAQSMVVYWNYQSPVCGAQNSNLNLADTQVGGATIVARWPESDMVLLKLAAKPDPAFNVYYSGWDASGVTPCSTVGIHHPQGHVKSINFDDDPPISLNPSASSSDDKTHWLVENWDAGTTEPGSSGCCLWNAANGLCVGQDTGSSGLCPPHKTDGWYSKLSVSWEGGGTAATRLKDWLNPTNAPVLAMAGADPANPGAPVFVQPKGFTRLGDSGTAAGAATEVAVTRVGNYAVTAVRTAGGNLKLITWDIDANGKVQRKSPTSQGGAGAISKVAITRVKVGVTDEEVLAVTAVRTASGNLKLITWEIKSNGEVKRKSPESQGDAGPVTQVAIARADDNLVVTPVRTGGGDLKAIVWQITGGGGIVRKGDVSLGSIDNAGIAVTAANRHVVTMARGSDGKLKVVALYISISDEIFARDTDHAGTIVKANNNVAVTFAGGYQNFGVATAVRTGSSSLKVIAWKMLPIDPVATGEEVLSRIGDNEMSGFPAGYAELVAASSVSSNRVITAVRQKAGTLKLVDWRVSLDGSVLRESCIAAEPIDRVAIEDMGAYLLVTAVLSEGKLKVIAWRWFP